MPKINFFAKFSVYSLIGSIPRSSAPAGVSFKNTVNFLPAKPAF